MAFGKSSDGPMPPPSRKGGLSIAIMAAKPKDAMPPPKMASMGEEEAEDKGQKHDLESAGVIRHDKHCKDCENWTPETGECSELPSTFEPEDGCLAYYEALGSGDEEESDDSQDQDAGAEAPDEEMAAQ